ncbi:UDP-N-acetylmuramate dehydrogenase [Clostridium sp.]|uniref:UDP-N-acetylmuramate dehydrogenase n=1 Tax=Clostridium sp. TaxID=1506 RepID=UPI002FC747C6
MSLEISFINKLKEIVGLENVALDEPMKNHTSFKVGGPVDVMVYPTNYEMVRNVISLCNKDNINYFILGNGSNLLVKDGGIRGVVIKFSKLNKVVVEGNKVMAESGAKLSDVSTAALNASLTGFEFACGIPGSIGGATTMNAGAYDGEMSRAIHSALVIDNHGEIRNLSKEELELSYRTSAILKYGYTVLQATLELAIGEQEKIKARIDQLTERRCERQPLEYASAGSTFKRPEGYFAGKLIQDAGLKGVHVGDAEVSEKHSGFIINKGGASAKDILELIALVQSKVHEAFGVDLHTEVRIIGEDS